MLAPLIRNAWDVVGGLAACASLPGSFELLVLSAASLMPSRSKTSGADGASWQVVVVVPAHNEAGGIAACVQSLLRADHSSLDVRILVIADNCTDATAELARGAGAQVLVRRNDTERGKGFALHYAFTALQSTNYDCVLVVDADTEVAQNFITSSALAMKAGADGTQVAYLVRNRAENTRTRLMSLAMRGFNVVRPRGRERLGLSVGVLGNGFGLRRETLDVVPYLAASVVEDLEYHLSLVRAGKRIRFLGETAVRGEAPTGGSGAKTQRSRWEGGRLRMLYLMAPRLVVGIFRGDWRLIEPLFELLLLPLAFHVVLLLIALSTPLLVVKIIALTGLAIVALHLVAAIVEGGDLGDLWALAAAPVYILWKLVLIPKLLRSAGGGHAWIRTRRNAEVHLTESAPTAAPR